VTKRFPHIAVLLLVGLLCLPAVPSADQAQYFYDELGRLVGVVDGSGNAAVYVYDQVGNLLRIDRFTTGATGIGIFFLAPTKALVNTNVTLKGFGFSATPSANQVAFNGVTATVVSATTDTLVATVPSSATTGSVVVTNSNGTATSPQVFTVLVPPIVSGVEPPGSVPQGATSLVVIDGFNLATVTSVTFAQSGLTASVPFTVTPTSLSITLAVGAGVPVGSYPFTINSPLGNVSSGSVTVAVTAAVPSFGLTKPLSVFKPFPAQTPPSGPSFSVAPGVSVRMP
jgi:YD repeat-containing protein